MNEDKCNRELSSGSQDVEGAPSSDHGITDAGTGVVDGGDDNMVVSPQKPPEGSDASAAVNEGCQSPQQNHGAQGAPPHAQAQAPIGGLPQQPPPPIDPFASIHPMMLAQFAMLYPQFQQMTPQQQQMLLYHQNLMMQHMALLQQHQQASAAASNQTGTTAQSSQAQQQIMAQQQAILQQQPQQQIMAQQQAILQQQQLFQQPQQQQLLQQQANFQAGLNQPPAASPPFSFQAGAASLNQPPPQQQQFDFQPGAAAASSLSQAAAAASLVAQQYSFQAGVASVSAPSQPAPPAAQGLANQLPQAHVNPLSWNFQNPLQGISINPSGIEAIYQADESNYQAQRNDDSDDGDLLRLCEDHHWVAALQRLATHPRDSQQVGIQGRTPLHVACDHDAPPALVQAILSAWPEGAERVGTSHMNPLHITCSSQHANVDVVRVLLTGCRDSLMITGAKDVDGDTPLHAACRCAAPMDVLLTLLQANPTPVTWKDYEGLNPLMRLWVRYFVLVGEKIISNIKEPSDLTGDLVEAWQKSLLLLRVMDAMENKSGSSSGQEGGTPFRTVHAAASVDCPRCVVRVARVLFPQELLQRDEKNRLPIHIAAAAPVYAVHDLRGEGFTIEDANFDDDPESRASRPKKKESKYKEPSVIDILLCGEPKAASERDPHGQLPLHVAIMRGKTMAEGVQALVDACPVALITPDNQTNLYPFMLAASVGRGRGDCSTIYSLLRATPELVHMALDGPQPPNTEEEKEFPVERKEQEDADDLDQKPKAKPTPTNTES